MVRGRKLPLASPPLSFGELHAVLLAVRLGAADFLEKRLGKKEEALTELRAVEALGLADADTWLRIGTLEEGFGNHAAAIDAYAEVLGTEPTHGATVARLAELMQGDERDEALARY